MTTTDLAKASVAFAKTLGLRTAEVEAFAIEVMKECLFPSDRYEPPQPLVADAALDAVLTDVEPPQRTKQRVRKMTQAARKFDKAVAKKLLCRAGAVCVCSSCGPVTKVCEDIHDGLKTEDFISKFDPALPDNLRLRAIDGCVMTDCPKCRGDMTLVLWGRRPEKDFLDSEVGSTGQVEA